jgi:hypothetical protein
MRDSVLINASFYLFKHFLLLFSLITTALMYQSCTRAYRFFPSSHHIPAFTKKHQVSAQIGFRNQHLAYSFSDHFALKASYFTRNISKDKGFDQWGAEHKKQRTGKYFDSEFGLGYYNPKFIFFRESFLGFGYGKTAFNFLPEPYSSGSYSDFYSTNFSIYGQTMMALTVEEDLNVFLTFKSKLMNLRNIHGRNITERTSGGNIFPKNSNEFFIWFNQVSITYRHMLSKAFQIQGQVGSSLPNRYSKQDFRSLWLEFSFLLFLDFEGFK